jgi:OmpA-OmpF porin, OOP family
MLTTLKNLALVAVVGLGVSACSQVYDSAKEASPTGDAYNQALYKSMMEIADYERYQEDWRDANYHASRAMTVANGSTIEPTPPGDRNLPAEYSGTADEMYSQLNTALASDKPQNYPDPMAKAFASYECYVEQAEEGFQKDDIQKCYDEFQAAMAATEPVASGPWTVYYPIDGDQVDMSGQQAVSAAADAAANGGQLVVQGHADTLGSEDYNLDLSKRRAQNVVSILNSLGIATEQLTVGAVGESELVVQTPDQTAEQENRVTVMRLVQ